jgi:hypothetical protein
VVALSAALAACSSDEGDDAPAAGVDGQTHVHAMALGADGDILIGTHHGLLALDPDGSEPPERISRYRHDFMGLAGDVSGRLVASGHPDFDSGLPVHLGLMESRDGGREWDEASIAGEADFHALALSGERVYGWDSTGGRFLVSSDGGSSWRERRVPEGLHSLAVDPADPDRVLGASDAMLYLSEDGGARWRALGRGGGLLAWSPDGSATLLEYGSGRVLRSADGVEWARAGAVPFRDAVALAAFGPRGLASIGESGVLVVSRDGGRTWVERASVREVPD